VPVFEGTKLLGSHVVLPCLKNLGSAQKAADMIGTVG